MKQEGKMQQKKTALGCEHFIDIVVKNDVIASSSVLSSHHFVYMHSDFISYYGRPM